LTVQIRPSAPLNLLQITGWLTFAGVIGGKKNASPALRFSGGLCYMAAMFSKTDLAIVFAVVIGALCVALYMTWIQPIQAIVAVVILVVAAVGLTVFS
jgi:hypothetical protein